MGKMLQLGMETRRATYGLIAELRIRSWSGRDKGGLAGGSRGERIWRPLRRHTMLRV